MLSQTPLSATCGVFEAISRCLTHPVPGGIYEAPVRSVGMFTKRTQDLGYFLARNQKGMGRKTPTNNHHIMGR